MKISISANCCNKAAMVRSLAASKKHLIALVLAAASLAVSPVACAVLGGLPNTDRGEISVKRATRLVAPRPGYEVHQVTLDSGTVVKEFVGPSGTVFGVAWQGPFKPDLNLLLGEHFSRLVAAGRKPHGDHRMLLVSDADLVIESGGKMRSFTGHAYLPAIVPAKVSVSEIR